ncbi:MAG: hypothetical protein ACT4N3_04680 [Sphingosinicella sp.]
MLSCVPPAAAFAQVAASSPAEATDAAVRCCTIPARTPLDIEITQTVNSRANQTGEPFSFRLAVPLVAEGRVVIPAGTAGVGEVVHAARARAMGKAGELILAARYLQLGESRIPLRTLRVGAAQGRDNSGAVNALNIASAATIPGLSLVAFMIAGGEVNVPAGTRASAQTANELVLAPIE